MAHSSTSCDILIAGGGLTGGALALALRNSGLDIALLDARVNDAPLSDARVLALGEAAKRALTQLGIWPRLATTLMDGVPVAQAVCEVRICQQKGGGLTRFLARDVGAEALGYMVSMPSLQRALDVTLNEALASPDAKGTITRHFNTRLQSVAADERRIAATVSSSKSLTASLLVIADGSGALLPSADGKEAPREHYDYEQSAILARLTCAAPLSGAKEKSAPVAYEYFTEYGPLALLPYCDAGGASYRLVWALGRDNAARFASLAEAAFTSLLNTVLGRVCNEIGRVLRATDRGAIPLQLDYAKILTGPHAAVLGNAAQRLHPVGAQGFNLALRDVMALTRTVDAFLENLDAIGSTAFLKHYTEQREQDRRFVLDFTHSMAQFLGHDTLLTRAPRALALSALDLIAPLRRRAARALIFGRTN